MSTELMVKEPQMSLPKRSGFLAVMVATAISGPAAASIPVSERAALQALYASTSGDAWYNKLNWNGAAGTECSWHGVTCDAGQTTVIYVALQGNNLVGTLTPLDALSNMTVINISYNFLSGSLPSFGQMPKLEVFNAGHNQLTGPIPSLAGLGGISDFEVWKNQLGGPLPELAGLSALSIFDVSSNLVTGSIPPLTGLTSLYEFYVYNNHLTGSIPSFAGLVSLSDFEADNNKLTGSIPDLADAPIKVLRVGDNQLDGVVPPAPLGLQAGVSNLCVNFFPGASYVDSPAWDAATGTAPWYAKCNAVFSNGFGP
jgi:hypothetical protein